MSNPIRCPEMGCGAFITEVGMGASGEMEVDCPECDFEGTVSYGEAFR